MHYTDFISFMDNPQNDELMIMAEKANTPPKELDLFDQEAWISKNNAELPV